MDATASPVVDARTAERRVRLETADVDVPPPPGVSVLAPLYFRVLSSPPSSLRVELWELGRPYGARSVSSTGTQGLEARRIALAAAELARQLRERRVLEIAAARRARIAARAPSPEHAGFPIYGSVAWSGGARFATVGMSDAWLVGPHLDGSLRFGSGPRVTLGGAWLAGASDASSGTGGAGSWRTARWLEVTLALSRSVSLGPRLALDVGLSAALASVRLSSPAPGSPAENSDAGLDTWSARGGALARIEGVVGRHVALAIGPDLGAVLRPIDVARPGGASDRLGGLWLGGTAALVVDPAGF